MTLVSIPLSLGGRGEQNYFFDKASTSFNTSAG